MTPPSWLVNAFDVLAARHPELSAEYRALPYALYWAFELWLASVVLMGIRAQWQAVGAWGERVLGGSHLPALLAAPDGDYDAANYEQRKDGGWVHAVRETKPPYKVQSWEPCADPRHKPHVGRNEPYPSFKV